MTCLPATGGRVDSCPGVGGGGVRRAGNEGDGLYDGPQQPQAVASEQDVDDDEAEQLQGRPEVGGGVVAEDVHDGGSAGTGGRGGLCMSGGCPPTNPPWGG